MQQFGPNAKLPSGSILRTLSRLVNHRIPFYQAALAASVLLFMVIFLILQNHRMPLRMAVADTVYVDRPTLVKDTVWLEKSRKKIPESAKVSHAQPETRNPSYAQSLNENPLYSSQMDEAMQRVSVISGLGKDRLVARDPGLMKLVVVDLATAASP